jgi:hypothetical protein
MKENCEKRIVQTLPSFDVILWCDVSIQNYEIKKKQPHSLKPYKYIPYHLIALSKFGMIWFWDILDLYYMTFEHYVVI